MVVAVKRKEDGSEGGTKEQRAQHLSRSDVDEEGQETVGLVDLVLRHSVER